MKILIIVDSVFGNTRKIADAVAAGLAEGGEVTTAAPAELTPAEAAAYDLVIAGSPTRKFSALPSVTKYLKLLPRESLSGAGIAAFDTRVTLDEIAKVKILAFLVKLFGYAAEPLAGILKKKGGAELLPPAGFYVQGTEGPLAEGELERAEAWGRKLLAARR